MAEPETSTPSDTTQVLAGNFKGPQFRVTYSNAFKFRLTPSDLTITFGVITDHPMNLAWNAVQDEVGVVLALSQAKTLRQWLDKTIDAIEERVGTIKIFPGAALPDETAHSLAANITLKDNF